jgi:hypothetical protein
VARAAASIGDLEAGTLPPVCAKTGNYADGWATIEFTSTPGWVWIPLLFGIFPFLIADHYARVRVVGQRPDVDGGTATGAMVQMVLLGRVACFPASWW